MTLDDDGEGFITLPDSTSKWDTVQVDEDYADLYIVVCASDTNLYLLMYIVFSSSSPSSFPITTAMICKYSLNPNISHQT